MAPQGELSVLQVRGRLCLFTHLNTNTHTLSSEASPSLAVSHTDSSVSFLISDSLSTLQFVGTFRFVDVVTGMCVVHLRHTGFTET